jgi:hypothetical protein
MLEKSTGEVLVRSGKVREGLPVLMTVATNALATAQDCAEAASVALGSGELDGYRRLCAVALARFAAGAEGINALSIAEMLLAAPQDAVIIQVIDDLVGRVEKARDFSKEWGVAVREWLEFRKGNPDAAAALWPKVARMPAPTAAIVARVRKSDYLAALIGFKMALPLCQLDRAEEARQAYAEGIKNLGPAPSTAQPRDLGESYARWYLAEAHRREAEQALKAKGFWPTSGKAQAK